MANILYGVNGEGAGHSTRAKEVLTHLVSQGHNVHVASFDRGLQNLKDGFNLTEIYGFRFAYVNNRSLRELTDLPETSEKVIRQNARWYRGVLDDVRVLWRTWRAAPTAFNAGQLCRHIGNKVVEWPIAAAVYPLVGFLGARAAGPEGDPGFSNHNSVAVAMHPFISPMRPKAGKSIAPPGPPFCPFLGHNALFY